MYYLDKFLDNNISNTDNSSNIICYIGDTNTLTELLTTFTINDINGSPTSTNIHLFWRYTRLNSTM